MVKGVSPIGLSWTLRQTLAFEAEISSIADLVTADLNAKNFFSLDTPFGEQDDLLTRLNVSTPMIVDQDSRHGGSSCGGLEGIVGIHFGDDRGEAS